MNKRCYFLVLCLSTLWLTFVAQISSDLSPKMQFFTFYLAVIGAAAALTSYLNRKEK